LITQRSTTRRAASVALATLLLSGLAGCSLLEANPAVPLSGIAACALGKTWNLDTAKLSEALTADLASRGIAAVVSTEGSQTFAWDLESRVVLTSDYTITSTTGAADQLVVLTDKHSGTSTGIAYINSEVAIPRNWDATALNVTTESTLNGAVQEALPYTLVSTDIDDSVGLELTCDGGTLTTHQRGGEITLTWTS